MDFGKEQLGDSAALREKQHIVTQMYTERSKQESTWELLSKYIYPMRGRFHEEGGSREGQRRDQYLIDPYPMDAITKCAAGLHSGLTSPSRPWFELSLQDAEKAEMHNVRLWLNDAHDVMMSLYARSNTYAMLYQIEAEVAQFGTAAALMLQDYNYGIWHRPYTCGEYCGGVDARGKVTSFGRRFELNARQMVTEFGEENVSPGVLAASKAQDITQRFAVEMLIERNARYDPNKMALGNFPWTSHYWEYGRNDKFLKISGFREQPFLMMRWLTVANEVYGTGPGHNALGDCMQLQRLERNKLRATDNEVDPAMVYPASMKKVDRLPGGQNFVPETTQMTAYPLVPPGAKRYEGIAMLVNEKHQHIASTFYNDLLVMLSMQTSQQMTAREVAERHEEKLLMLGPVLEQFHNEVLEPLTLRTFGICLRNGLFPPMPDEISEAELKVDFVSLLAQAQKMVELPSIQNVVGMAGNLAAIYPEIIDNIDSDAVIRKSAIINGAPEKIIRSEDDVQQIRRQRAEAQAQAEQAQQMAAAAGPVKDVAQAARLMSETPTSGGNALDEILGGM